MNKRRNVLSRHRPKKSRRGKIIKNYPYGRILKMEIRKDGEWLYHATKGWRKRRLTEGMVA